MSSEESPREGVGCRRNEDVEMDVGSDRDEYGSKDF